MAKQTNKYKSKGSALFTLAAAVVSGLVSIAVKGTGPLFIVLIVVAAILVVFSLMLWYQLYTERDKKPRKVQMNPKRLWNSLSSEQRDYLNLALSGAANDVANTVGMRSNQVRANMFAPIPRSNRLAMVEGAYYHMDLRPERTIQMEIGKGCTGRAFETGDPVRAIWKDGWGPNDLGNDAELKKVHPELRWILSVPIRPANDPLPVLALNVDGLERSPSPARLGDALLSLVRYGEGIRRTLKL